MEDQEVPCTWVSCKRNDLISMLSDQLLSEDYICLLSENEGDTIIVSSLGLVGELADKETHELALSIQPKLSFPPPFRSILKSIKF